ncbi:FlgD immunoglobulin-like domain containing protein, partial [Candidatus Eisenbacteria bacterium]
TFTPSLEIADNDDSSAGYVLFEFLRDAEITTSLVNVGAHLWFDSLEDYKMIVREHGSAAEIFTTVLFAANGLVYVYDEGGSAGVFGPYETGRVYPVRLIYNMDVGTYSVRLDDVLVLADQPHGVVGRGVGSVGFGCAFDADYDGRFYLDNVWVSDGAPPGRRACCVGPVCERAIPGDCAYNAGEFHAGLNWCEPNPCVSAVEDPAEDRSTVLLQSIPNPFRNETVLRYHLARPGRIRIDVLDLSGRLVCELFSGNGPVGGSAVTWDGRDHAGRRVAPGVYFGRVTSSSGEVSRSVIVLE